MKFKLFKPKSKSLDTINKNLSQTPSTEPSSPTLSQLVFDTPEMYQLIRASTIGGNSLRKKELTQAKKTRAPFLSSVSREHQDARFYAHKISITYQKFQIALFSLLFEQPDNSTLALMLSTLEHYSFAQTVSHRPMHLDSYVQLKQLTSVETYIFPSIDAKLSPKTRGMLADRIAKAITETLEWQDIFQHDKKHKHKRGIYHLEWDKLPRKVKLFLNKRSYLEQFKLLNDSLKQYESILTKNMTQSSHYPGYILIHPLIQNFCENQKDDPELESFQKKIIEAFKAVDILAIRNDLSPCFQDFMDHQYHHFRENNRVNLDECLGQFIKGQPSTAFDDKVVFASELAAQAIEGRESDDRIAIAVKQLTQCLVDAGIFYVEKDNRLDFIQFLKRFIDTTHVTPIIQVSELNNVLRYYEQTHTIPRGFIPLREVFKDEDRISQNAIILKLFQQNIYFVDQTTATTLAGLPCNNKWLKKFTQGKLTAPNNKQSLHSVTVAFSKKKKLKSLSISTVIHAFTKQGFLCFSDDTLSIISTFLRQWFYHHDLTKPESTKKLESDVSAFLQGHYDTDKYVYIDLDEIETIIENHLSQWINEHAYQNEVDCPNLASGIACLLIDHSSDDKQVKIPAKDVFTLLDTFFQKWGKTIGQQDTSLPQDLILSLSNALIKYYAKQDFISISEIVSQFLIRRGFYDPTIRQIYVDAFIKLNCFWLKPEQKDVLIEGLDAISNYFTRTNEPTLPRPGYHDERWKKVFQSHLCNLLRLHSSNPTIQTPIYQLLSRGEARFTNSRKIIRKVSNQLKVKIHPGLIHFLCHQGLLFVRNELVPILSEILKQNLATISSQDGFQASDTLHESIRQFTTGQLNMDEFDASLISCHDAAERLTDKIQGYKDRNRIFDLFISQGFYCIPRNFINECHEKIKGKDLTEDRVLSLLRIRLEQQDRLTTTRNRLLSPSGLSPSITRTASHGLYKDDRADKIHNRQKSNSRYDLFQSRKNHIVRKSPSNPQTVTLSREIILLAKKNQSAEKASIMKSDSSIDGMTHIDTQLTSKCQF